MRLNDNFHKARLFPLIIFVFLASIVISARLFQIQILLHNHYHEVALKQHKNKVKLELPRGRIYDRRGIVLGLNIPRSYSYAVNPQNVKNPRYLASVLSRVTGYQKSYFLERIDSSSSFVWLLRQLSSQQARRMKKISGLVEFCETRRYYPFGWQTPKLIGFTDRDCKGIAGLEETFDLQLSSKPGWEIVTADGLGNQATSLADPVIQPIAGSDLILTIDNVLQNMVCRELKSAVENSGAKGGMALVMLPRTGELLSVASIPSYDPNIPSIYSLEARRELSVVDMFEPGSTFKIVPLLAALKKGMPLTQTFNCENGIYRAVFPYIQDDEPYRTLTLQDIIVYSSNIGTAKITSLIGSDDFYACARDLGFGCLTGIEIPGEARGILPNPHLLDKRTRLTIGFGHGVTVTALQLACAYGAIANDGILMRPRVVRAISKLQGEIIYTQPVSLRRVVSRKIAKQMTEIFIQAVERGTGKAAQIKGITIAGKTGTSQKYITEEKGFSHNKFISSFIGFTVEEPRLLCLVILDEPQHNYYGGSVSAPVFRNIMEKAMPIISAEQRGYHIPYQVEKKKQKVKFPLPNLANLKPRAAIKYLEQKGIEVQVFGLGTKITGQNPLPYQMLADGDSVTLYADQYQNLPRVEGMTIRKASKLLIAKGFSLKVIGSGVVQSAEFIDKICILYCDLNSNASRKI